MKQLVLIVLLLAGCARTISTSSEADLKETEKAKWDNRAASVVETKQHSETAKTEKAATYRRKTTPSPAGPIVEEEWAVSLSELREASGVVAASRSESRTTGETFRNVVASSSTVETMTSRPWWWWPVVVTGGAVLVALAAWQLRRRLLP